MTDKKAYLYILQCSDSTLYTGYTTNLENRIKLHNLKKASKYTRTRTPVKYVYTHEFDTKNEAMSYEKRVKSLSRVKKIELIQGKTSLDQLFNSKSD